MIIKKSENGDSALMRRGESGIMNNTEKKVQDSREFDRYGPMSYVSSVNFKRLPHKNVPPGANKIVAICASTGGPKALSTIIPLLPKNLNAPVVLVQHMAKGFTASLARHMNDKSEMVVKEAEDGEQIEKGCFYLAKGGSHLRIMKRRNAYYLAITDEPARSGLKPCADIMYESLDKLDFDEIICVVLTGMGSDGTRGIGHLSENHNVYVIAQDEATSSVYGMPGMVKNVGITDEVLPLDKIADAIIRATGTIHV